MDIKKLFMDNKAVSPVIGVILMVAITVILAAAIGSSVFGQGTAESAPQANLDVQAVNTTGGANSIGYIRIEHLGGDPINFATTSTKIMVTVDSNESKAVLGTEQSKLGTMSVGDVKTLPLKDADTNNIKIYSGNTANIKFVDIETSQLICDKEIRF